jgi:hypothetical protein
MPQDNRLNFDASDDFEIIKGNLLKDVEEATEAARQRKASDKARDARQATESRDKTLMYVIIAVAVIVITLIAYKVVFAPGGESPSRTESRPGQFVPMQGSPPNAYQARPVTPVAPTVRPQPQAPPSAPVRRNGSDTYDEGPSSNGAM